MFVLMPLLYGRMIVALDSMSYISYAVQTSRRLECLRRAQTPQRHGGRLRGRWSLSGRLSLQTSRIRRMYVNYK